MKLITLTILIASLFFSHPINAFAQGPPQSKSVGIEAAIPPSGAIRLFGYTGAQNQVIAEGIRSYAQTFSDEEGYFIFQNIYIADQTQDLCIYAIDSQNRSTYPVCIPVSLTNQQIGPVLLPPTISLKESKSLENQNFQTSGQTIPQSNVNIILSDGTLPGLSFIPQALAIQTPKYTIKSDQKGNYYFNLPINNNGTYRLFSIAVSREGQTPKSQTLSFTLSPEWTYLFILILAFLIISLILFLKKHKEFIHFRMNCLSDPEG